MRRYPLKAANALYGYRRKNDPDPDAHPACNIAKSTRERFIGHDAETDFVSDKYDTTRRVPNLGAKLLGDGLNIRLAQQEIRCSKRQTIHQYHSIRRVVLSNGVGQIDGRINDRLACIAIGAVTCDAIAHLVVMRLGGGDEEMPAGQRFGTLLSVPLAHMPLSDLAASPK